MRKSFLTYALVMSLLTLNAANAKDLKPPKTDLSEIILNTEQVSNKFEQVAITGKASPVIAANSLIADGTSTVGEKAIPLQTSIDNENNTSSLKEKNISPILDLKGGVETSPPKAEASVEKTVIKQWLDGDYATGKWFGARPLFEDHGVTVNSSLLYSPFMKTGGGANGERSGKGYSLFNLSVTVDTEKAGMWKGGTFYGLYQRKAGYGISGANGNNGAMGDWMGLDGWDWRQINQISEYWYQQKLFNDKFRMKVGKQDANIDFGYLNSGWDFMNTAFSVNPTTPMPTYPDQSFGFMAEINPKEWLSIRNGIYNKYGSPFNITEIEVKPMIKKMPGRYMLGAWEMSETTGWDMATGMNMDGSTYYRNFNRNYGMYAGFEQMVYKEKKDDENDMQGLVVFGQFGMSPSNRNDMNRYAGGGLHYVGPIPKRDNDRAGIAIASGNFASRLGDVGSDYGSRVGSETAVECFYRVQVTPWFYLQPDVQLIMNPGGMYGNSVAIGLRSVVTF